ncbi:hypothetical protein [Rubritalea tangerina]
MFDAGREVFLFGFFTVYEDEDTDGLECFESCRTGSITVWSLGVFYRF